MNEDSKVLIWVKNNETYDSWDFYRKKALVDAASIRGYNLCLTAKELLDQKQIKEADFLVVDHTEIGKIQVLKHLKKTVKLVIISGDEEIASKFIGYNIAFSDLTIFYLEKYAKRYNLFNNIFLMPEAADYRDNITIQFNEKINGAIYVGAAYPARIKIVSEIKDIIVHGAKKWQKIFPEKYFGELRSDLFYSTISKYKSSLCLMELDDSTPHLNAKIFDSIVAGTIPIVPGYAPFTETYSLPSDCYYTYRDGSEINKLIQRIDELPEYEYLNKITKLRNSQLIFSYDLQYNRLLQTLDNVKHESLRSWTNFGIWPLRIKIREQILRRLLRIMLEDQEKMIPIAVQIFGLIIPSRLSPVFFTVNNKFRLNLPVFTPRKSILNLPLIKMG